jgi:hypothetical protein
MPSRHVVVPILDVEDVEDVEDVPASVDYDVAVLPRAEP